MNDSINQPQKQLAPQPIARVINLIPDDQQRLIGSTVEQAKQAMVEGGQQLTQLRGSYALLAREGERVLMARSLDRPMRYFLAKEKSGPMLIVADRIDAIRDRLAAEGYADQFEANYTRMVPAHHLTRLRLIGCPDPNPEHLRFVQPQEAGATDVESLGKRYVGAMLDEVSAWLETLSDREPIGVLFSGGIDSGAVLLAIYRTILNRGEAPQRLKAFTLSVAGGSDLGQACEFLDRLELSYLHEVVVVEPSEVDPLRAVEVTEDYKPLDVECAAVNLALVAAIRRRYPEWKWLVDGDGGDENLKDYPIEENTELTIRSVVNNPLLYQEGWGVDAIKHSLVHSGGYSRGCVRTYAPLATYGFQGFSPYTAASVVEASTAIPFRDLAQGSHERLYALKGEIVAAGVRSLLGFEMPVFGKRRFQDGAVGAPLFAKDRGQAETDYRRHYRRHFRRSFAA